MLAEVSRMESAISHGAGWPSDTRRYISSGVKGGMRESTRESVLSGVSRTVPRVRKQKIRGMTRNILSCCSSCSELVMAPNAAAMDEEKREPRMKEMKKKMIWGAGRARGM